MHGIYICEKDRWCVSAPLPTYLSVCGRSGFAWVGGNGGGGGVLWLTRLARLAIERNFRVSSTSPT